MQYPDFLLSGQEVANVTGKKKSKLWGNGIYHKLSSIDRLFFFILLGGNCVIW
jgi:hypothetical protein